MERLRVSYKIEHNDEDSFFPLTVKVIYDNRVISTDFAETMDEVFNLIKEKESSLVNEYSKENHIDR